MRLPFPLPPCRTPWPGMAMTLALYFALCGAAPTHAAKAVATVTEVRLAPRIEQDPSSPSHRDPVGGIAVEPPCSGQPATVSVGGGSNLYLWFKVDATAPVSLTATWNHLPEGAQPSSPDAWQETLRSRVEVPEASGYRVWMVKRLDGESARGRWIVTLSREGGEVVCSVPFRVQ